MQLSVTHLGPKRDAVDNLWICLKKELITGSRTHCSGKYLHIKGTVRVCENFGILQCGVLTGLYTDILISAIRIVK